MHASLKRVFIYAVHFFSLEPECLGVLLSQLVVTLSSLIDDYPKIITEALNYLIIEHRYIMLLCTIFTQLVIRDTDLFCLRK